MLTTVFPSPETIKIKRLKRLLSRRPSNGKGRRVIPTRIHSLLRTPRRNLIRTPRGIASSRQIAIYTCEARASRYGGIAGKRSGNNAALAL